MPQNKKKTTGMVSSFKGDYNSLPGVLNEKNNMILPRKIMKKKIRRYQG